MANLPAVRALTGIALFAVLACVRTGISAQVLPFAPGFPTDAKECQSFNAEVEAYAADYSRQHEQCLADNKADRQETPDSQVCSRSTCQYLHDMIYGDSVLSAKSFQKEVATCFQRVEEYQAEEAQKKKDEDDEEAKKKQDKADRDARTPQEKQNTADEPRGGAEGKSVEDQQVEANRIAAQPRQQVVATPSSAAPRAQQPSSPSKAGTKTSSVFADPFSSSNSRKSSELSASNRSMVNPFANNERLADPFPSSASGANPSLESDRAAFEGSSQAIELSTNIALSKLDKDISFVRSQSRKTISATNANALVHEIQDTKSILKTVNGLVTGGQYFILAKNVASAESSGKRDEAWGELLKQATGDVLRSDLVKEGMTTVAPRLFGERVGLLLVGAASASINSGVIILDPTKTGRDDTEVIHDTSGKVSLSEKQTALMDMWKGYERRQSQGGNSDDTIKRQLWTNSNIVYNECEEAKADCERWRVLLDK